MKAAIDTNILLRLILEDNKAQLSKARKIIKENEGEGAIFVSSLVFLEMYFVLTKLLSWSKAQVYQAFEEILSVSEFSFENEIAVRMAISDVRKNLDFSDALIGQVGQSRNLKTYTFDKKLKKDTAFIVI